ncbi:MAG: EamA/RhaT family transporter, partial [Rhizobium giardinii]
MTLDRLAPAIFVLLWSTGWVIAKYAGIYADP